MIRTLGAGATIAGFMLVVAFWLLMCCSPVGPSEVPEWVHEEWREGQARLRAYGFGPGVESVEPESFQWAFYAEKFKCVYPKVNGCFDPPRLIMVNTQTPQVVISEAQHAILYRLGSPHWRCPEHDIPGKNGFRPECLGFPWKE